MVNCDRLSSLSRPLSPVLLSVTSLQARRPLNYKIYVCLGFVGLSFLSHCEQKVIKTNRIASEVTEDFGMHNVCTYDSYY